MDTKTKKKAFVDLYLKDQIDFNVNDIIIYLQILDLKKDNENYLKHFKPIEDNIKTFLKNMDPTDLKDILNKMDPTDLKDILNNMDPTDLKDILNKMEFQDVQALRPFINNKPIVDEVLDKKVVDGGKRKPLTSCTVSELKAKAKKRGINVTGLKKAEIIAKLRRR